MNKENYFNKLNNINKDKRLEKLELYAKEKNIPIIQNEGLMYLINEIKIANVKNILEIGTAIGYSAINFALINENINVTTIERDEKMFKEAINNIKLFDLSKQIKVIFKDALEINIEDLLDTYDMIFIDAAKSQYQRFFEKFTTHLKKDGIVITDNLIFHNLIFDDKITNRNTRQLVKKIKNFNEFLANNHDYDTYFSPLGDGIAVSIKKI